MAKPIKVWLRKPRKAWRNDGGPIPRGFRSRIKRRMKNGRLVTITCRSEVVRKGHWAVLIGGDVFAFTGAQMKQLYSCVPL